MDIGLGAAAFWISIAAFFIAMGYFKSRADDRKQQTLLRLLERTGQLDDAQVKLLFPPPTVHPLPPHHPWLRQTPPGAHRRAMRIFGTIVLSIAAGLAIFFTIYARFGTPQMQLNAVAGYATAALIACFGIGLFVAGLFLPPAEPTEPGEREAR